MTELAQRSLLRQKRIQAFQTLGQPVDFGGVEIQLCAMPRNLQQKGYVNYGGQGKHTRIPRGEQFYPYKLGYRFKRWEPYCSIHSLYRFLQWQLMLERNVHFLDETGQLKAVKSNRRWKPDHVEPLKQFLELARKPHLEIDVRHFIELET